MRMDPRMIATCMVKIDPEEEALAGAETSTTKWGCPWVTSSMIGLSASMHDGNHAVIINIITIIILCQKSIGYRI